MANQDIPESNTWNHCAWVHCGKIEMEYNAMKLFPPSDHSKKFF